MRRAAKPKKKQGETTRKQGVAMNRRLMVLLQQEHLNLDLNPLTTLKVLDQIPVPDEDLADFKTEYHPHSKCPALFQTSDEFRVHNTSKPPPNPTPWHPFRCKGDFKFTEIALEASLNKGQVKSLLDLISRVAKGEAQVTFVNEPELWKLCDWAAEELTPSKLPRSAENAAPLAFILYTDKSKLSSFGTVKGYPIIARCANLPAHIQNSNDIGGGTVVGWLPIVPEDAEEDGKLSYMTLKRVVWHESFFKLLEEVIQHARSGYVHACHDKVKRTLFPLILILSADYQEHFDRLHSLHLGIWGKHIFGEIKKILEYLGQAAETMVEKYVAAFPSWQQLAHFSTVINITFNDGNKMQDLAKQVFYSLLNIFKKQSVPEGYTLLQMLQIYLELNSLIGLNVHMERTLSMIESELLKFNEALKEYIGLAEKSEIPGLKSKGVTQNYSTWPNESMHGALREAYNCRTNGRDVVSQMQILRVDQHMLAMKLIRQSFNSQDIDDEDSTSNLDDETLDNQPWTLGLQCKPAPMQSFKTSNPTDTAFSGLRKKFTEFLNTSAHGWGHQNISYIRIPPTFEITEYRYLKMNYRSTVDWRETTDHLRCNPQFYGKLRYDCALIQQTETMVAFICFILIFTCHIPELDGSFKFALVQPFTRRTGASHRLDSSIVRGAVLAPDPENADEFLTLSYLDDDMFLRLKDTTISGI
ncbi:hypothetical protein PAXRUDRAFT_12044 [Paxillus rubicundulus Ve08.2h10]|uniref:Unplaced genomic scaffold scaffold_285, whole genome shotgun sequence n=1 Tax=Paxillus rubicundulus Ve08.2h10 TaxID=930991 RepID=A0A0D0DWX9_9AGAM|nr:hypothetical protein PAXRUDRAFT_12044 [Paxillus rubicundulus Ve08.2h10]